MKVIKTARVLKNTRLPLALLIFSAVASCARMEPPQSVKTAEAVRVPDSFSLHYFFDRTESMRGFVVKGNDSDYVKSMRVLWDVGAAMPNPAERIYDYGDSYTREYKESAFSRVKDLVRSESFYGLRGGVPRSDANCDWVKNNNERPFASVAEYIKTLEAENTEKNRASIVVTDLYDLGTPNPFVRFFSDTFSAGLSGAIFAIESSFSGTIESVSSIGDRAHNITVRNARSTFFVCVAGDSAVVSAYSAALAKELHRNNITYNNAVFLIASGENIRPHVSKSAPHGNREFSDAKYAFACANIGAESLGKNVQSYRLLKFDSSRWAAGLPLANINFNNFAYKQNSEVRYYNGKTAAGNSAAWQSLDSANVTVQTLPSKSGGLYIAVETKNKPLKAGYYEIAYTVISEAKPAPAWVSELNAPDIASLQASVNESAAGGASVKVLNLANVYARIAEAFNKVNSRRIYSGVLYLIKR